MTALKQSSTPVGDRLRPVFCQRRSSEGRRAAAIVASPARAVTAEDFAASAARVERMAWPTTALACWIALRYLLAPRDVSSTGNSSTSLTSAQLAHQAWVFAATQTQLLNEQLVAAMKSKPELKRSNSAARAPHHRVPRLCRRRRLVSISRRRRGAARRHLVLRVRLSVVLPCCCCCRTRGSGVENARPTSLLAVVPGKATWEESSTSGGTPPIGRPPQVRGSSGPPAVTRRCRAARDERAACEADEDCVWRARGGCRVAPGRLMHALSPQRRERQRERQRTPRSACAGLPADRWFLAAAGMGRQCRWAPASALRRGHCRAVPWPAVRARPRADQS